MKILAKEDVLDYQMGASVLCTGGGGIPPTLEAVGKMVDRVLGEGHKLKFIGLEEVPDDEIVFSACGTGGHIRAEMKEKWARFPNYRLTRDFRYPVDRTARIRTMIMQADREWCPLNTWSKLPGPEYTERKPFSRAIVKKLTEITGRDPYSYIQFEVASGFAGLLCGLAKEGKPYIDATNAGHRAAPEISQNGLNLANVPCTPAVLGTLLGDLIVIEETLCFQRMEEIIEGISTYSGGVCPGLHAVKGSDLKKAAFSGVASLTMKVGKAIRGALKAGKSPVDAMVKALGSIGFKLFEGELFDHWMEGKYSFRWGVTKIIGTGPYEGHDMKIWYKNENHISWLDGKPYVTSPDGVNVIDVETGYGLNNGWPGEWEPGRKVAVVGVKAEERWETPMGLKLFGPQHFRFDIQHKTIDQIYKKLE